MFSENKAPMKGAITVRSQMAAPENEQQPAVVSNHRTPANFQVTRAREVGATEGRRDRVCDGGYIIIGRRHKRWIAGVRAWGRERVICSILSLYVI